MSFIFLLRAFSSNFNKKKIGNLLTPSIWETPKQVLWQTVKTQTKCHIMQKKCHIMQHFIRVYSKTFNHLLKLESDHFLQLLKWESSSTCLFAEIEFQYLLSVISLIRKLNKLDKHTCVDKIMSQKFICNILELGITDTNLLSTYTTFSKYFFYISALEPWVSDANLLP